MRRIDTGRRRRRGHASAIVERLEHRRLLAVTANVTGTTLLVNATAADSVTVTASGGNVRVNGVNPATGAFPAASLTVISVACAGNFSNVIDLSAVTRAAFASLATVTLNGGPGNDTVTGGELGEVIIGGGGSDNLTGNDGDDVFDLTGGTASVNPGAGTDTIRYLVTNPAGETVSLSATATERLEISGGAGPDNLTASGGAQVYVVSGGGGADTINASGVTNPNAAVILNGGAGNDTITGGAAADLIVGGGGVDNLTGNAGNDIFDLSGGNATVNPGDGTDTVRYIVVNPAGETVSLSATATERLEMIGGSGPDHLTVAGGAPLFIVTGGGGNDTIDASGVTNVNAAVTLRGDGGNDTITGSEGPNLIEGGTGNDSLIAAGGNDTLSDGSGNDSLSGGTGDDRFLLSSLGVDAVQDSSGRDTADFSAAAGAVALNMDTTAVQALGGGNSLSMSSLIEDFVGSIFKDSIRVTSLLSAARSLDGGADAGAGDELIFDTRGGAVVINQASVHRPGDTPVGYAGFEQGIVLSSGAPVAAVTLNAQPPAGSTMSLAPAGMANALIARVGTGLSFRVENLVADVAITVNGSAGNDHLLVTSPTGLPPGAQVTFTGGGHVIAGDVLELTGPGDATDQTHGATGPGAGAIVFDPQAVRITYAGVESILDTLDAARLTYNAPFDSADQLVYENATLADTHQIRSPSGGFTPYRLRNKRAVTVHVGQGVLDGADQVTVNTSAAITGLSAVRFELGRGADAVTFQQTAPTMSYDLNGVQTKTVMFTGQGLGTINLLGGTYEIDNDAGGRALSIQGSGSALFDASQRLSGLSLVGSATATLRAVRGFIQTDNLLIGTGVRLDLRDGELVQRTTAGGQAALLASLNSRVATARNGGPWNGLGIASSVITPGRSLGINAGNAGGTPAVIVRYTLIGDINLDRSVDFNDLAAMAQNYNTAGGRLWSHGDLDFSGAVGFDDLAALAQNYNMALPPPADGPVAGAPAPAKRSATTVFNAAVPIAPRRPPIQRMK